MDTKRLLTLFLVGFLFVLPFINTGCTKRGEEDPFFSMYTRKARITGEWEVKNLESIIKSTTSESPLVIWTTTTIEEKTVWKQNVRVEESEIDTLYSGTVIRYRIEFDKNGRMKSYYNYQYTYELGDIDEEDITRITVDVKEEITGTWDFLVGIDDFRNKERLAIVMEEKKTITTKYVTEVSDEFDDEELPPPPEILQEVSAFRWAPGEMSTVYVLTMLKNKEAKLTQKVNTFQIIRDVLGNSVSVTEEGDKEMIIEKL
jgi:hypothetical protein